MPNPWLSLAFLPASICQCRSLTFQTVSPSRLANSTASVMRRSSLTYNVCSDLSCLLCINLRSAAGGEVTERQIRTSSAVWRMVAAVPPGHGDGTTSIQPLWSLKCRAFWLCQHCSAQHCSNSPDHCQKPRSIKPREEEEKVLMYLEPDRWRRIG